MEFIPSHAEVKLPEVIVTQSSFWVPFHVVNGPGELRELKEAAEYADIVAELPAGDDGFTLGTRVQIETTNDGIVKVDEVVRHNNKLYIPRDRCKFADLAEVEGHNTKLFDSMLLEGISTALKVTNGYIGLDPHIIEILD